MKRRRGSTLVESAFALLAFATLLAGIAEIGLIGFAANTLSFAAQRAARYAAVCGSASGHAANAAAVQAVAQADAAPLAAGALTVNVSWTPDNHPGSTVQVQVRYSITPDLLPVSAHGLTLQSTARATIVQ